MFDNLKLGIKVSLKMDGKCFGGSLGFGVNAHSVDQQLLLWRVMSRTVPVINEAD